MKSRDSNPEDKHKAALERCKICGSKRVHVYPTPKRETKALCLKCGARYAGFWIDPEDLG